MENRRVVITGIGTVNPLGNNVEQTWDAVVHGRSGIGPITKFDASDYSATIAGEVRDFDPKSGYGEKTGKLVRRLQPFVHYAMAAVKEAIAMSGLEPETEKERTGICFGSGEGGLDSHYDAVKALLEKGHRRINPFYVPASIGNIAAGTIGIEYGAMGPNISTQTACATANHAMATAFMIIKMGMADSMITGGSEAGVSPLGLGGFTVMRALSTQYNDSPEKASRPYDVNRDGFVMGEGAGAIILEELEHAKKRGARILAELVSVGMSGDAYDLVVPEPEGQGAYLSMKMSLDQAGIGSDEITYVNTHGTSTPLGDVAEAKAVHRLLQGREEGVWVGSTKSMHGHLLGAAAALEGIICIKSIMEGKIPGNINLDEKDPEVPLNCLPTSTVETKVNYVLSNSFGFGGHNSTVVFRCYEG